jgi:hypothetical protein
MARYRWLAALPLLAIGATEARAADCQRLFMLRRSSNRNQVIYEACFRRRSLDRDLPVRAYWQMLETDGHREELTALEERFAYGVLTRRARAGEVTFSLRAAPDRALTLRGRSAIVDLRGQPCALVEVYVEIGAGWPIPGVRWVELRGVSLATGAPISERIAHDR